MTNPLDANGVAVLCPVCSAPILPASSHTAVEPVGELVRKLLSYCMDWDDEPMADAEEPRVMPYCGELREAASTLTAQAAALVAAEKERDAAILAASEHARARGEAEGALHVSELAGVVDGWKARAEAAEKRIAELEAGLDAAEAYNEEHGDPADTLHHGRSVLAHARRRTHQEKNNAG